MVGRSFHAALGLAFLVACSHHPVEDPEQPSGDPTAGNDQGTTVPENSGTDGGTTQPDAPSPPDAPATPDGGTPVAACPIGVAAFTHAIGLARADQRSDIAVDAAGNVLFATAASAGATGNADGVTKLSPSGEVLLTLPFGSVIATDAAGNFYVAGAFTAPLDVGLGVMQPEGNVDVFVAKFDAAGKIVFAQPLRLCGDGVTSIAVDATGRIAVSGTALGTVVLSPTGELQLMLAVSGDVAFNSHGALIIGGTAVAATDLGDGPVLTGDVTSAGFVLAVDGNGQRLFSHVFPGKGVVLNSVAVDHDDNIVFTGFYTQSIELFGDEFHALGSPESGRISGGYSAKLDASGAVVWKHGTGPTELNGVAVDLAGNVVLTGADTGNLGFNRITELEKVSPAGDGLAITEMFPATGYGRGFSVATDACGGIYLSAVAIDSFLTRTISAYVVKLTR